jgi:hypothetical protein
MEVLLRVEEMKMNVIDRGGGEDVMDEFEIESGYDGQT